GCRPRRTTRRTPSRRPCPPLRCRSRREPRASKPRRTSGCASESYLFGGSHLEMIVGLKRAAKLVQRIAHGGLFGRGLDAERSVAVHVERGEVDSVEHRVPFERVLRQEPDPESFPTGRRDLELEGGAGELAPFGGIDEGGERDRVAALAGVAAQEGRMPEQRIVGGEPIARFCAREDEVRAPVGAYEQRRPAELGV